jgi:hypothetical protein
MEEILSPQSLTVLAILLVNSCMMFVNLLGKEHKKEDVSLSVKIHLVTMSCLGLALLCAIFGLLISSIAWMRGAYWLAGLSIVSMAPCSYLLARNLAFRKGKPD